MSYDIKIISQTHELYESERRLRLEVLLRPIGLEGWWQYDDDCEHIVAVDSSRPAGYQVIGCVLFIRSEARLCQMVVETEFQGKGMRGTAGAPSLRHRGA